MKLTVTQTNHIMKRLKVVAQETLNEILPQLQEQIVPPRIDEEKVTKYLTKMVYDKPQAMVNMCLKWARGMEPKFLHTAKRKRAEGFNQFNELASHMRAEVDKLLSNVETQLLWDDDWNSEYPEFLEVELVNDILNILNGGDDTTDHEVDH